MSASDPAANAVSPGGWLANQPYLLLCITALCWAGNAIVGRLAAGHIPPVTLSFLRWSLAFLIILPFAWKHLMRDWGAIRARLGIMIVISVIGIGAFNTLQYWALEHTQALNTLLLQSAGPLFVAVWSLILLGVRLTLAQAGGIAAVAGRRAGDPAARRPDRAHQHPVQQGRHHLHRRDGDLRIVFGADAEASANSRPVVCELHLRLRRGVPHSAVDLGIVLAAADATEHRQPADRCFMSRCFPRRSPICASIAACS